MQVQESSGLILFSRNYREKDKLVKIFTESYGKVMFFVKNAHRPNKSLSAAILPFTSAVYVGSIRSNGLSFLNDAKDIQPFNHLQLDIFSNAYATYVLNLVDVAIEDYLYDPALYGFTRQVLLQMNQGQDPAILTAIFEIQLLNRFGYDFNWQHCAVCGRTTGKFDFSSKFSGVLCQEHFDRDPHRYHCDARGLYFVQRFSQLDIRQVASIQVSQTTQMAIRQIIDEIYQEFVGIQLKSKRFIDNMATWEAKLPKMNEDN